MYPCTHLQCLSTSGREQGTRWNIAFMYENGLGLEQDFHLAKRMYDMCYATNSGGYVPVQLALSKLYVKWVFLWLTGRSRSGNPFTKQIQDFAQVRPGGSDRAALANQQDERQADEEDILSLTDDFEDEGGLLSEDSLILGLALVGAFLLYYRNRLAGPQDQAPPRPHEFPIPRPRAPQENQAPAVHPALPEAERDTRTDREAEPETVQTTAGEEEEQVWVDEREPLLRARRPFAAEQEAEEEESQDDDSSRPS